MGYHKYHFFKIFDTIPEAIEEIVGISWSLKESDLSSFASCSSHVEFEEMIGEVLENAAMMNCPTCKVWATSDGGFTFLYETSSGVNCVELRIGPAGDDEADSACVNAWYSVVSHADDWSEASIASDLVKAGWEHREEKR